jgi:hypothetical protein
MLRSLGTASAFVGALVELIEAMRRMPTSSLVDGISGWRFASWQNRVFSPHWTSRRRRAIGWLTFRCGTERTRNSNEKFLRAGEHVSVR